MRKLVNCNKGDYYPHVIILYISSPSNSLLIFLSSLSPSPVVNLPLFFWHFSINSKNTSTLSNAISSGTQKIGTNHAIYAYIYIFFLEVGGFVIDIWVLQVSSHFRLSNPLVPMNVSQPHLLANLLVKPALVQKRTLATTPLTNVRTLYVENRTHISVEEFILTFWSLAVSLRSTRFNIQKFYMALALRWVFCTDIRTDSNFCFIHHWLIGFYNRGAKRLLRGTNWFLI